MSAPSTVEAVDHTMGFREMHQSLLVMPGAWDVGSARFLESAGFRALEVSAEAMAFAHPLAVSPRGRAGVVRSILDAVAVPVSVDLELDDEVDAAMAGEQALELVDTGVTGLALSDRGRGAALVGVGEQTRRLESVRRAVEESGRDVVLAARTEAYTRSRNAEPIQEVLQRLVRYTDGLADVASAPGVLNLRQVRRLVEALHPAPLDTRVPNSWHVTVSDLADLGVRRISLGSSLARVAWGGVWRAVTRLTEEGSFTGLAGQAPVSVLQDAMRASHLMGTLSRDPPARRGFHGGGG